MHRLIKLLASNDAARLPKLVRGYDPDYDGDEDHPGMPDVDGQEATLFVYDVIGGWDGPATQDLVRAILALKVSTIHLRVNSPGGLVFDAAAIKTALEQNPAKVIAHVDGLAASAASTLILAADEIEISAGGFIMIHNPETMCWGDSEEMLSTAAMLDNIRDSIVSQYAARTGLDRARLQDMMGAETWLSAEQAVEMKFCDRIATKPVAPANKSRRFDLSAFDHAPSALLARVPSADTQALIASRIHAEQRLRLYLPRK